MEIVYSTSTVRPRDRVSYWVEVATKEFFRHAFQSRVGSAFAGELRASTVGELGIGRLRCDPCEVDRQTSDIARDGVDDVVLSVLLSGTSLVAQGGREAKHPAGMMALLEAGRPNTVHLQSPTDLVTLQIPRESVTCRLKNLTELTGRPIPIDGPISGLATGFLSMLAKRAGALDQQASQKLSEQALDLVALAFSSELKTSGARLSSGRAAALMRLKSAIEARLYDRELRPAAVAAEVGISARYANALLADEGSSVERYIQTRRLERCRQALEDPRQAHRTISEIALAWGYSDMSHFGRRFRAAYGMTPGDHRRRAQEAAAGGKVCR